MDQYDRVHLYLDHDTAGRNYTQRLTITSPKFIDESHLYKGYKDLNEWAQQIGKSNIGNFDHPFSVRKVIAFSPSKNAVKGELPNTKL